MKNLFKKYAGLSLAALVVGGAGSALAQTQDLTLWNSSTGTSGIGVEWGTGSLTPDNTVAGPNDTGSLKVTVDFTGASDTPAADYICFNGGNPWYQPLAVNLALYKSIDFDVKWDTTSDITISEFNDLSTWPATLTNSTGTNVFWSWAGAGYLSGSLGGLDFEGTGSYNQMGPSIYTTNLPTAAANGWVHMSLPINPAMANIDAINGLCLHKWVNQCWGIVNPAVARFWIDNLVLKGTTIPLPPKLSMPVKATPGLNVFASTEGSLYDRQSAVLRQNSGLSWVGQATPANPVTYSFTIAGYPTSVNCEAWMFLVPNPAYMDNSPDWNETNCAIVYLQGSPTSATMHFQYKVNEASQQGMYSGASGVVEKIGGINETNSYTNAPGSWNGVTTPWLESGNLAQVTNNSILGTWTIKFTSDTNGTLIAPDGNSTNFVFPTYNIGAFAENPAATTPFYLYLGMQANNADAINQAVVYSQFSVNGTASPYSENFLTDSSLDTVNVWNTGAASGPKGVLVVPGSSALWVSWSLPDAGFGLQATPTLNDPLAWTTPSIGPALGMYGVRSQLIDSSEVPAGSAAFFELIKRTATQLQVLLPGEVNAPGTATGKTGTPTAESVNSLFTVTVNMCDSTWHIVSSTDAVSLSSATDPGVGSATGNLVGGTAQITTWYFDTAGSQTVTASDTSNTAITSNTSSSVVAQ
jgi:hypothetical protein